MPPAKRQKKSTAKSSKVAAPQVVEAVAEEGSEFARVAKQHWLKPSKRATKVKVKNDVLKRDIWDPLEKEKFPSAALVELESLQLLESYLWPGYSEASSNHHVLLIVLITNAKRRERLQTWGIFEERPDDFSALFRRILSMSLDRSLPVTVRTHILSFVIHAFQSLDYAIVRKECAPLVSISIWHNLSTETKRDARLDEHNQLRKAWRASAKRYDSADEPTKARLRFDRSWLYTLALDFLSTLYSENASKDDVLYCERFAEFLSDLQSQLPTRRYVNFLLQDLHILPAAALSPTFNDEDNGLLRDLIALLSHFTHFTIDDQTGAQQGKTQAIRRDIEDVLRRLRPETGRSGDVAFPGSSKMALPISKPSVLEVLPAPVGDDKPAIVRAEIVIDVRRLADNVRREWEALRPDDVVFLLAVEAPKSKKSALEAIETEKLGLRSVRCGEIIQILDDKGRAIRDTSAYFDGHSRSPVRKIQLKLDAKMYKTDQQRASVGKPDVYESINLVMRRGGRENNFKPVLESIKNLTLSEVPLASWLHEVFLGYGDPAGASYKQLPNRLRTIDYRDTFLDWQHLIESMPGKIIEPSDDVNGSFGPPYVLETVERPAEQPSSKPSKKRRRDAEPALLADVETVKVSTYEPPNNGPYPVDAPKLNAVRFTPAQIEGIMSGSQPGLTVVVGPPGTGKTDVATQIINNIYHNFPEQRTLLIAHSNQALNQLFAKIVALDIDERHLLRLGHGEEDLGTEGSFSKHGRVESFLENRDKHLQEVTRLAASIGAPGAHGNSSETAGYFNSVYIQPAWSKFSEVASSETTSAADVAAAFPFHYYFSNAPQPLFPPEAGRDLVLDIANGCYRHISKIFSELADALPFEILRRDREKANYLLTNEARIVAMTSTHAAMRRGEIAQLGFHYDNVVMEEAAQITEIENFIPLAMQKPKDGQMPLQRVVLCGDHFQNSPVVQNLAFRDFANLEQSLFSRLIRLGVPAITLDQQGRARPSIAKLYQWRYNNLGNLPHVESAEEYLVANAGFKYDYQFINVPDYKGKGEVEPTPHFIQNLGEAEYAVAIYQYMRLLGYPASKISILTTYAGQRALIRDVLGHRCARNSIFGLPKIVTTVDKYQGEQNDYVILSLTRTSRVGYLRDIRRLTVALSRAKLGLYILGRRDVFEGCFELREAFEQLLQRPDKLTLVTGELWPSQRKVAEDANEPAAGEATMESVEHLGQYVFEMTTTKVQQLQAERGLSSDTEMQQVVGAQKEIQPIPEEDEDAEGASVAADGSEQEVEDGEN
ncbi:putative dead helicases superfamily protein [Diaporthe ampelina]|uniref:Pre-mRNA-splicing factor n=1 Tax=Diaporthe ampelina TaxID=1214573 RepID=A0A0G2FYD7_9PEZI|nr:putative dead helicases superfamily protein [Diaporthe ampelina]